MNKRKQGGYIMILNTLFFIAIMAVFIVGVANTLLSLYYSMRGSSYSKQSYLAAESAIDEAIFKLKNGMNMPATETIALGTATSTVSAQTVAHGKTITAEAESNGFKRKVRVNLSLGTGISFHYGIQAGQGGFVLLNSSSVTGNIFSGGAIRGEGNFVYGEAISSGPSGLIDGIHATGTAYAHTISNSIVDGDAYYMHISGTTVGGTSHPNAPDLPDAPLPITDEQIAQWESDAEAGGSVACTNGVYSVTNSIVMGPKVVPCNLEIKGNGVNFIMSGPVWVKGNITTQTGPILRIDPSLGSQNVALIADDPANRNTGSIITIGQNTQFFGSGSGSSFVFSISQNNNAENGGSLNAINMGQSAGALVAYAGHGQVTLGQSVGVKEVTAWKIILQNTANVVYDTGLPSVLFSAGPGGGYDILDWLEI